MSVEKQILRLEITVNNAMQVQVFERERNLGSVEFGDWVRESLQVINEFTVLQQLKPPNKNLLGTFEAD